MGKLEGFWVRNYGVLRQVGIGSCFLQFAYLDDASEFLPFELGTVTLFTGACGTGKTTLLDVFMFLSDSLRYGVEKALLKRGGFDAVYSFGGKGPISIGLNYREDGDELPCTYAVSIDRDASGKPYVATELLAYREGVAPFPVLYIENGTKTIRHVLPDERLSGAELNQIEFTDFRHLGLARLENHPAYPAVRSIRLFLENWYMNHFSPDIARGLSRAATARFVNPRGSTLADLVASMRKRYGEGLQKILDRVRPLLPQVASISVVENEGGEPHLVFGLPGPEGERRVAATRVSDGLMRLFTYILLMEEPLPAPLIGLEEPENGLDRIACWKFIDALSRYSDESARPGLTSQLFVTTHHPGLADSLRPEQVWVLELDQNGFTSINRASDDLVVANLLEQGRPMPPNWFSDFFESKM